MELTVYNSFAYLVKFIYLACFVIIFNAFRGYRKFEESSDKILIQRQKEEAKSLEIAFYVGVSFLALDMIGFFIASM